MKLLHVHDFFAPGNSRYGFDMDRLLVARGHQVHVLAGVGPRGPAEGDACEGVVFHTYPYRDDLSMVGRFRYAQRMNLERFEELQERHGFDGMILNQPLCASGVLKSPLSRSPARIYSYISSWAAEWRAGHPESGRLTGWIQAGLRNRLEDWAVRACDVVMVESDFVRAQLQEHHPDFPAERVTLVPGAVDVGRFAPNGQRTRSGGAPVILTVRRLVARMGVDMLLRAAAQVPEVEVIVGGDGPLRSELEQLAATLGVRAKFLGYVPDEDLPSLYRAADLFVLPTRALEGFGLTAIEAMACGTPAMGTPVGAIPEVLGPLDLLFEAATPEAIAAGLRRFLSRRDPDLGRRCREYVASRYDWSQVIEAVEKILLKVIHESPGHRRE